MVEPSRPTLIDRGFPQVTSAQTAVTGLAGRYATALFELARDEAALDAVAEDLGRLQAMIDESADLRRMLASPLISRDARSAAMAALADRAGFADTTRKFLGLIAAKRRLFALPRMIRDFNVLLAASRGETTATVVTATELSETQAETLAAALRGSVGTEVRIDTRIDPALLGGMIVRVGSRMVDSSLRTKLERLRLAMKGVA